MSAFAIRRRPMPLPARSCVQEVLYKGAKVEIEVQAFVRDELLA